MNEPTPKVVIWFRVYLAFLCVMYGFCVALGVFFAFFPDYSSGSNDQTSTIINGWLFMVVGSVFLVASALPFFLKPKPWVWVYNLVIICLGKMSCCLLPACIPLLIFWIKPETKRYFGRME
jgi:hypothetical protein